jgi:FkbM family methyltransferase
MWPRFADLPLPVLRVGFEADAAEAQRLQQSGVFDIVVPAALSARAGKRTLYLARDPGSSSILGPNLQEIERHCEPINAVVVREVEVDTITLEHAIERFDLPLPDFIKLDIEGAEFEVLSGGDRALEHCAGIFFEARFAEFYRGETLLGGLCTKLLARDFSITSFEPIGSFNGAIMLVDVSACRNLRLENRRPWLLKCAAFALVVGNFEYAIACLRKVVTKRKILFG